MLGKVGDKDVYFVTTMIVPDNQDAKIDARFRYPVSAYESSTAVFPNVSTVKMNITLRFEDGEGTFSYNFAGSDFNFVFRGWKNAMGNGIRTPVKAGTINYKGEQIPFGFFITSYYLDGLNVLTLQVVTGGTYEQLK